MTAPAVDLDALAAELRDLSDGLLLVTVEFVVPWPGSGCELCQLLECVGDAEVSWWHGNTEYSYTVGVRHLAGWVPGFVIPSAAAVAPVEAIRVEIGRAS